MPRGPKGEKRPADVIGAAIMVAKIATGDIADDMKVSSGRVRSGKVGGKARAAILTSDEKKAVARVAASTRWNRERRRVMDNKDQCQALAQRFQRMAVEEGLVDVKFFLRNLDEALKNQVCGEVEAVYEAFEAGDCAPLNFRDSYSES